METYRRFERRVLDELGFSLEDVQSGGEWSERHGVMFCRWRQDVAVTYVGELEEFPDGSRTKVPDEAFGEPSGWRVFGQR